MEARKTLIPLSLHQGYFQVCILLLNSGVIYMDQIGQFIINHWGLWVLLIAVMVSIIINERVVQKMRAKELTPDALVALLNEDKALVIDLRDKEAYRKGHIINAIQASEDDFLNHRMDNYKSKTLVLVCARANQSMVLATKLRAQGFGEVLVLAGGMNAWLERDLPVIKNK